MLWRIKGTRKYFLGSIHILPEGTVFGYKDLGSLEQWNHVVFETDFTNLPPNFGQDAVQPLNKVIPVGLYLKCKQRWSELNISKSLKLSPPVFAGMQIAVQTLIQNGNTPFGVDKLVSDQIGNRAIHTFLEPQATLEKLSELPIEEQIKALAHDCRPLTEHVADFGRIFTAWNEFNLPELENVLARGLKIAPEVMNFLVPTRNHNWLPEILKIMTAPGASLFVLGCLHFTGEHSVQSLLYNAGGHVFERVSANKDLVG